MRKRVGWIMTVIVCASAAAVALARRDAAEERRALPSIASASVAHRSRPEPQEAFIGVVVPSGSVEIASRSDGRIETVHVRMGDRAKAGQVLVALDARTLRADLEMARAASAAAEAEVDRAVLEQRETQARYERRAKLAGTPAISQEEIESARYQAELAEPHVAAAQATSVERAARVRKLEHELADAVLVAPFDGIVAARYVDPGAHVTRGAAILRLIRAEGTWVRFAAPDSMVSRISAGALVDITMDGNDARLVGNVETIAPQIDPASRLVIAEARVDIDASEREKLLGRVARVRPR